MYTTEEIKNLGLKDIHVGALPSSMGSWIIIIVATIAIFTIILMVVHHFKPVAINMFSLLKCYFKSDNFACDLNKILKVAAIRSYAPETIASLSGEKWTNFLDKTGHTHFSTLVSDWNALLYGNGVITSSEKFALLRNGLLWLFANSWRTQWSK